MSSWSGRAAAGSTRCRTGRRIRCWRGRSAGVTGAWADPDNLRDAAAGFGRGTDQFGGPDGGAAFVVLCDGSVHRIDPSIDPQVFAALGTPDGGEAIGAE